MFFEPSLAWGLACFSSSLGFAHFTADGIVYAAIVPPPLCRFKPESLQLDRFAMELSYFRHRFGRSALAAGQTGGSSQAYLLAVLPANIFMALEGMPLGCMQSPTAL